MPQTNFPESELEVLAKNPVTISIETDPQVRPKVERALKYLRELIQTDYEHGDRLPGLNRLVRLSGAGQSKDFEQAMGILREEGIITVFPRSGMFVSNPDKPVIWGYRSVCINSLRYFNALSTLGLT